MLLHQELNEPALYTSILDAIASGAPTPRQISDRSGVAPSSVGRYPQTLESLGIVERRIPFGEKPIRSRKGLYRIRDPFHAFWYRFVSPYTGAIETASGEMTASQVAAGQALETCSRGNHPRDMDPLASNCPVHRKRRAVPWILMHGASRTLVGFILPRDAIPVPSLQESFWLDPHQSRLPMVCPRAQVGDKCHDLVLGVAHAALEVDQVRRDGERVPCRLGVRRLRERENCRARRAVQPQPRARLQAKPSHVDHHTMAFALSYRPQCDCGARTTNSRHRSVSIPHPLPQCETPCDAASDG